MEEGSKPYKHETVDSSANETANLSKSDEKADGGLHSKGASKNEELKEPAGALDEPTTNSTAVTLSSQSSGSTGEYPKACPPFGK